MTYGRRDKLRMHIERVHDVCIELFLHVAFQPMGITLIRLQIQTYFVCDICCTSFESDDKLQEHKVRHENAQDLECGICLSVYSTPEDFNEHLCITYQ